MAESTEPEAPSQVRRDRRPPVRPGGLADPALDAGGLPREAVLELLREGELTVEGRLVDASNATLFCAVEHDGQGARCVYKPVVGERPLWDFPDGTLAAREVAAFLVSETLSARVPAAVDAAAVDAAAVDAAAVGPAVDPAAGADVGIVPPTVMRDGPFGQGMAQLWIDVDVTVDVMALTRADDPRLRRVSLFDAVINNADRKGGHLLPGPSGRVYGIDHGVTFHTDNKLRTVLWTWRGRRLAAAETAVLTALRADLDGSLGRQLDALLTRSEVAALTHRVERLLATRRFPMPSGEWPAVPWPPF